MTLRAVSITEETLFTALRAFLVDVLPSDMEIVQGQDNGVPMPSAENFVVLTAANRAQLAGTVTEYAPTDGEKEVSRSTRFDYQIDIYGAGAADNCQVITTLLRDDYGVDFIKAYGLAPLYCEDGQQMPLVTGEKQYLGRWMMRGALQANVAVTVPMQFADTLITTLLEY